VDKAHNYTIIIVILNFKESQMENRINTGSSIKSNVGLQCTRTIGIFRKPFFYLKTVNSVYCTNSLKGVYLERLYL